MFVWFVFCCFWEIIRNDGMVFVLKICLCFEYNFMFPFFLLFFFYFLIKWINHKFIKIKKYIEKYSGLEQQKELKITTV